MQKEPELRATHNRDCSSDITEERFMEKRWSFGDEKTSTVLSH